ncbi:MAG: hypothetical protein WAT92_14620 [Saprospiraceae bacterium]|nr:hypothetical protein [Saprospiraceae bacterium]HMS69510.1 hypothetical protein [Saprospiraceae bacterium]
MIANSQLNGTVILNEKVRDVLLIKLPNLFFSELEFTISSLEGKVLKLEYMKDVYESLVKIKTGSLEKGVYVMQMAYQGMFVAKTFEKE